MKKSTETSGFTIVELLIVIVVIGILAAITVVAFNDIQDRARQSKIDSDLSAIAKAAQAARINNDSNLFTITADFTDEHCFNQPSGTDLATLPQTHECWTKYHAALDDVSVASGMNVRNLVDPWGRPYYFDENEGEGDWAACTRDVFGVYSRPFVQYGAVTSSKTIPLYSTAC